MVKSQQDSGQNKVCEVHILILIMPISYSMVLGCSISILWVSIPLPIMWGSRSGDPKVSSIQYESKQNNYQRLGFGQLVDQWIMQVTTCDHWSVERDHDILFDVTMHVHIWNMSMMVIFKNQHSLWFSFPIAGLLVWGKIAW